jgi:hypothetical protein
MKENPSRPDDIRKELSAGAIAAAGFLGDDSRCAEEIIAADAAALAELGVAREDLARRLAETLQAARDALGAPVQIAPNLTAVMSEGMGRIACPWGGCGVFEKGEAELVDSATQRRWRISPLGVHLVAAHGFFQGKNSPYRLDVREMCAIFGLEKKP